MAQQQPQVAIVMGSDSDWPVMEKCVAELDRFGVACSVQVISAHRSPELAHQFASGLRAGGVKVVIAAAGMSAALAGVMASLTTLPVIGVPMPGGALDGLDALLSTVQMPPGVPVATVGLGGAGAKNAAVLAVQILALADAQLADRLAGFKQKMAGEVVAKSQALQDKLNKKA